MSISKLLEGDFAGYFAEQKDKPVDLWFFLHVPKTAGSSFWQELARALEPNLNVGIEHERFPTPRAARAAAVQEVVNASRWVRAARAHVLAEELTPLHEAVETRLRLVTMLRDPVNRVISDFRYSRTPAHPGYQDTIRKFPTLEDYIESRAAQNKITKFLRRAPHESVAELFTRIKQEYSFVGLTEAYPVSRRILHELLGRKPGPAVHERSTESRPENEIALKREVRDRIRRLNAEDEELVSRFRDRFLPLREPLRKWLKTEQRASVARPGRVSGSS